MHISDTFGQRTNFDIVLVELIDKRVPKTELHKVAGQLSILMNVKKYYSIHTRIGIGIHHTQQQTLSKLKKLGF